jgi:hypothetical protein
VRDVQQAQRVWVDGRDLGIVLEQERRIPLMLRGEGSLRRSASDLQRVILALPGGRTVALSQVARISEEEGQIQVIREGTQRYATVLANVRGRDLVGFVAEAQAAVAAAVKAGTLPAPAPAMMSYRGYDKRDRIQNLWVMSVPNKTPEAVGVSTVSQRDAALEGKGLPWMMLPGTPGAHIMIPINPGPAAGTK